MSADSASRSEDMRREATHSVTLARDLHSFTFSMAPRTAPWSKSGSCIATLASAAAKACIHLHKGRSGQLAPCSGRPPSTNVRIPRSLESPLHLSGWMFHRLPHRWTYMPWAVWLPARGTGSMWASKELLWRLPADPVWRNLFQLLLSFTCNSDVYKEVANYRDFRNSAQPCQ